MKFRKNLGSALLIGGMAAITGQASAHTGYNPYGYDGSTADYSLSGYDGGNPSASGWGGPGANYAGALPAMWYASFHSNVETHTLSTEEALVFGLPANFELSVGAKAWEDGNDNSGLGDGMDFGLIKLKAVSSLTITVEADGSNLLPAISFYKGYATGGVRSLSYDNNDNNPLGTTGLELLASIANDGDGSVTYTTGPLAAGKYSLFIGDDDGAAGGKYKATLSSVPVPAAVWLFGSGLVGLLGLQKRKMAA